MERLSIVNSGVLQMAEDTHRTSKFESCMWYLFICTARREIWIQSTITRRKMNRRRTIISALIFRGNSRWFLALSKTPIRTHKPSSWSCAGGTFIQTQSISKWAVEFMRVRRSQKRPPQHGHVEVCPPTFWQVILWCRGSAHGACVCCSYKSQSPP